MTKEQKVGLFFFVGILLAFIGIEVTVGTGMLKRGYHLWVNYQDVQGLNTGDPVRVAGVKRGKVDQINITPETVRVRLRIDAHTEVRRDAVARLDFSALSGTRFIAISLGTPQQPVLKDGDTLAGEQPAGLTEMVDQLGSVAESVKNLTDSLNRNQEELIRRVNQLIDATHNNMTMTIANMASITEKLDRGDGTFGKLINDPALYDQANQVLTQIHAITNDLQEVSSRLAHGDGTLGKLVRDDGLYEEARDTVSSLNVTARNLEEISNDVRDGHGTLGRLIADDGLYVEAQDAVRGLDRAASGIEDQAPISVLGTFVSTLF